MSVPLEATRPRRLHYAWVVAGVTFLGLLVGAGVRAAPGALINPLEAEFGWTRASISLAVAVSILFFGLGAPLAGGIIDRFGPRLVAVGGMLLIALGLVPLLFTTELWFLYVFWGLAVGIGTGAVGGVIGATVATRWFRAQRGLVIGLFAAAASMGQLLFLPTLVAITVVSGWRTAVGLMAVAVVVVTIPLAIFLRDRPEDVGTRRYGDDGSPEAEAADALEAAHTTTLRGAMRSGDFWLLATSFFVCGYTSNGLIGTHLIPHAVDHGYPEVTAATAVGLMGMMNVVGTLASGWLTDRYDNRRLLAIYYALRAVGIATLPFISGVPALFGFAVIYGLDWIATVPPTTNLTAQLFGRRSLGTIYGWIFFAHMLGASIAALLGGLAYDVLGDYSLVFLSAAALGFIAAALAMRVSVPGTRPQAMTTSVSQT